MASKKKKKYKPTNRPKSTAQHNQQDTPEKQAQQTPPAQKHTVLDTLGGDKKWLALVVVVLASLFAYTSAFDNQLTNWDDNFYVNDNPVLRELNGNTLSEMFFSDNKEVRYYMGNYHPLAMLSLAVDFQLGGTNKEGKPKSWPYITTNVIFHLLNTGLVFFLIYLIWGRIDIATIAALLFGVHTIHVESVAWISERKDVLYTFFYLISLIAYVRYATEQKAKWLIGSLVLFILSLLSKGQAVSLAPTLILIDWFKGRKLLSVKVILEKVPFFALGLIFGLIAIEAQKHGQAIHRIDEYPYYIRVLFASFGFVQYLLKLAIPHSHAAIYPYPILTNMQPTGSLWLHLFGALGILALGVWAYLKKYKNIAFGMGFFLVNIVLLLQLIPVGSAIMADRYSYIPSIGIHALTAFGFMALYERFKLPVKAVYGLVAVYAIGLGVYTFKQIDTWQDSMSVWSQTLKVSPKSVVAWNNRGSLKEKLAKDGEEVTNPQLMQSAILDFNEAIKIKPDYTTALYNRGVAFNDLKRYDEAMADFNEALKHDPTFGDAYHNRGLVKDKKGKFQEAITDFNKAVQFKPQEDKIYVNRGVSFGKMGNYPEAIKNFNKALELAPNSPSAYSNRGLANDMAKNYEQALKDYAKAIEIDSKFATAYMNRGLVYLKLKQWEASIADLSMAIQLKPNTPNLYFQRARAYVNLQRFDEVCKNLRTAKQMGMQGLDNEIQKFCK